MIGKNNIGEKFMGGMLCRSQLDLKVTREADRCKKRK